MEATNHTKRTFTAAAIILAQSKLSYNQSGKEVLMLKVLLGQRSMLCRDGHPFTTNEILIISAHKERALSVKQNFQVGEEVLLTVEIIQQHGATSLQLEHIEHYKIRHTKQMSPHQTI